MTRIQFSKEFSALHGNRYAFNAESLELCGDHIRFNDLEDVANQKALKKLLARVSFDITDKGLAFFFK